VRAAPRVVVATAAAGGVPDLVHASDVVLGFFSNLLLEADALGRPVVRYHPGDAALDPLSHLSLGTFTRTADALARALDAALPPVTRQP
jgi:hypothetical protein